MNISSLRALLERGTARPWYADKGRPGGYVTDQDVVRSSQPLNAFTDVVAVCNRDAALIAAAVNALPLLLDVVEAAKVVSNSLRHGKDGTPIEGGYALHQALAALETAP